ncbi:MAG: YkvA family protein [Actinocatenispora sp.]
MTTAWVTLAGVAGGVVLLWLALLCCLAVARPRGAGLTGALRLLPDLLRLVARLAREPELPRGVRVRLWLLLGYLASPIDLIPDFVPVLGYADDAIVVAVVLRSVVRRAGPDAVARHWPGTPAGLAALHRLTRTTPASSAGAVRNQR